ncbi:hypothetical protein DFQ29_008182 [Apophysomyces sp. BC1021]|nr:hypothetical protein DFQ29_008182 [Apophysomyces sp. BC1021]
MISYAEWSPTGHQVAYVMHNDLYVCDLETQSRITYDGSSTVFNGIPDWVYEEEVLQRNYALWWAPDSTHVAYMRFNETSVPEYRLQFYTTSNTSYPDEVSIKYPKPGAQNPLVSLHVYSLLNKTSIMITKNATSDGQAQTDGEHKDFEDHDRLITDVAWATTTHTHLLFKQTNRVQDHEKTSLVEIANNTKISLVRDYKPTDGGWVDISQTMTYLSTTHNGSVVKYLDIAEYNGFMHLAIYTVGQENDIRPTWLTQGEWEVIVGSVVVDKERQLMRPAFTKQCQTCPENPEEHAYYSVSFSSKAGYYLLNYEGPDVPSTHLRHAEVANGHHKERGHLNARELLPPDFDISQKYPVLFHVYGGPGSQLVSYQFQLDWHTFLASKLKYIVVMVDGRGTGYRGRKYKVGVRGRLGELEAMDQVNAARHWASLNYVDKSRIAIWGWSYGGYLASKVVETNTGVFSTAMAVAPVSDWRYYDSIYTERYMLMPESNAKGYNTSAVSNMTGFENTKYLLVHGTGDDNVHFQHSAVLLDKLTKASIHNYRFQMFTDSNHAMAYHEANQNLYYLLTNFLWESFGGKEYMHIRQESFGHFSGSLDSIH